MKNVSDIAAKVAEDFGMTKTEAEKLVKGVFSTVAEELGDGEDVNVNGFGKFVVKDVAARQGRNPATGATVDIAASRKVAFKAAKQLKDAV